MVDFIKHRLFVTCLFFLVICFTGANCYSAEFRQGIAVWDLENTSPFDRSEWGEILTAQLSQVFSQSATVSVVERTKIQRVLEEQHLGSSMIIDQKSALSLGKLIGARLMVFGAYTIVGPTFRVDIRVVNVENSMVLKTVKNVGKFSEMKDLLAGVKVMGAELIVFLDDLYKFQQCHP